MQTQTILNATRNGDPPHIDHDDFPAIIVITCILSLFSVVGVTGNAFVLYVFFRKKDKSTSTVFILALAATDLFTSLFIMPYTIAVEFLYKKVNYDIACKVYQFLITSNVPFSAFIMVAIAFDRYFCICRPWMKLLDIRCAKRIIVSLFIFATSLGLITCLAYGVYHYDDNQEIFINASNVANETFPADMVTNVGSLMMFLPNGTVTTMPNYVGNVTWMTDGAGFTEANLARTGNITNQMSKNNSIKITRIVYTGFCLPNELILGSELRKIYQTFYASLFLITLVIVLILYALIYKSILSRRSKKLRTSVAQRHFNGRRSTMLTSIVPKPSHVQDKSTMTADSLNPDMRRNSTAVTIAITDSDSCASPKEVNSPISLKPRGSVSSAISDCNNSTPDHELLSPHRNQFTRMGTTTKVKKSKFREKYHQLHFATEVPIISENTSHSMIEPNANQHGTITIYRKDTRKSVREKNRIANIKTAGILFIVTIVFIVAFLPSWLMAIRVIPANMIVFYMYFVYNVANPVIYAFCNHAFQNEVKKMLKCHTF